MSTSLPVLSFPLLITALVIAVLVVAGFAVGEGVLAWRERRSLASLGDESVSRRAAEAVVEARTRLARVIETDQRPEPEIRRHPALGNIMPRRVGSAGARSERTHDGSLTSADLDDERIAAREALLDAQRLWESVRPRRDTEARVGVWSGRGRLRAWQFGPIGFERVIIRSDHLLDAQCWVVSDYRRLRWGFGFGAEILDVAVFAAATPSRRLDELLRTLLSGTEVALRPGFAPSRWWRSSRRSQSAQAATQAVLGDRRLDRPPDPVTTDAVWAAVVEDFGPTFATTGLPGLSGPMAVVHTSGPSLMLGAWWGRRPRQRLLAASSHVVWRELD